MVYHYYKLLPNTVKEGVYTTTKPDNAIGTFWLFDSDIAEMDNNNKPHKQLINNGYKYQCEQ